MKTLYLCEKPSQAKDIATVLKATKRADGYFEGASTIVTWCFGHLLEMANPDEYGSQYKKWSFESLPILPTQWQMSPKHSSTKQLKVIKQLLASTEHVVVSTDADREGETIAREIMTLYRYNGKVDRLWLSALDTASIQKALVNVLPGEKTEPLYQAGLGRSRADWLVGMNMTRAYTLLFKQFGKDSVISVGRVQTPTLNLVVVRDLTIDRFVPVPFYDLVIECDASSDRKYKAKWLPQLSPGVAVDDSNRCLKEQDAATVRDQVEGQPGEIIAFNQTIKEQSAPLPFDLSSLQIEASKRFSLDANQVLEAAQALYETHKATTYPRTDCRYLPTTQFSDAKTIMSAVRESDPDWWSGNIDRHPFDIDRKSRCWNDKKITAHHAIIPTAAAFDFQKLSQTERQIYELVRCHYLIQFYEPYRYEAFECKTLVNPHTFISHGKVDIGLGFRVLTGKGETDPDEDHQKIPVGLSEGTPVQVVSNDLQTKQTKPPARFTSGTLIQAMKNAGRDIEDEQLRRKLKESSGIGTEATRANIIDTLLDRTYIKKQGKHLVSTELGRELIGAVPDVLKSPETTAIWEQMLNNIADCKLDLSLFIHNQETFIRQMIDYLNQQYIDSNYDLPVQECPECGKNMRLVNFKKGRKTSKFWSCTDYPECTATLSDKNGQPDRSIQSKTIKTTRESLVVGNKCPECKTGNLLLRNIKSGKNVGREFIGCSGFPICKAFAWPK